MEIKKDSRKVIIIGAGGFVGGYLIKEFQKDNYSVVACDINKKQLFDESVKYYDIDILNKELVETIIKEELPDFLINLAAISSVRLSWDIPEKTMEVNVIGTLHLLEAIKKYCPQCKTLLIGSSEEYEPKNEPLKETDNVCGNNPYGISKIAQEYFAKIYKEKFGLNIVCTRSFNHTGLGQPEQYVISSFCKQIAEIDKTNKSGKIYVGNLSAYRDISAVKDIVKVYKKLLENNTEELIYNVGSGKTYKIEDLLKFIISLTEQHVEIIIDKEKMRPIDIPYTCCDNSKIAKYFDNTDIKETIKEMYEHYRNN